MYGVAHANLGDGRKAAREKINDCSDWSAAGLRPPALETMNNNRPPPVQAGKRVFTRFFAIIWQELSMAGLTQFQHGQREHRAEHAQDVKTDHHLIFVPAFFLKMMMHRGH